MKTMANKKIHWGILAVILVLGMAVVSCGNGTTDNDGDNTTKVERLSDDATLAQAKAKVAELLGKSDLSPIARTILEVTITHNLDAFTGKEHAWTGTNRSIMIDDINDYVDGYNSGEYKSRP